MKYYNSIVLSKKQDDNQIRLSLYYKKINQEFKQYLDIELNNEKETYILYDSVPKSGYDYKWLGALYFDNNQKSSIGVWENTNSFLFIMKHFEFYRIFRGKLIND